jgi:SAM-dependent methyltransferase
MIDATKPSGYDAKHFQKLVEVEDRHFWFASRNRILASVLAKLTVPENARVLEIGTGTGNTLRILERAFPGAALVGVDLFEEGLAAARLRTRAHLVRANTEQLPFQREFDLIGAFDVLEHVEDDRTALTHIRRLLTPGGHLVLTVPACARLWSRFDSDSHHFRRYEPDQLRERLAAAGFVVERLSFFFASLYPVLRILRWVSDRLPARKGARSPVARELRVVPIVNAAAMAILEMEAWVASAGLRLPIGTSLLAIARRRSHHEDTKATKNNSRVFVIDVEGMR